jgi:hypothetical protein
MAHGPGPVSVKLALTAKGRALLKHSVKVSAQATFTPSGGIPGKLTLALSL